MINYLRDKNKILGSKPRFAIEAGVINGWEKYIGNNGLAIGINHFGSSAPATDLAIEFGFTSDQVTNKIEKYLKELL